ncbi:zinc-binding dehydrogenase [Luteibacter pinisoli]|uniref:Zinc-binding dehydrogenase n=1 Tax=Luteibacter pinisoli TaxID=2589080 RepID=A0A4Y5YXM8_9GAMM|nr:zinc-binding dehydrogenase [Luteibacter pinisoli]QDE37722.1 zinc-binding dehydrogenase [Luteibacter pinisoli]
MRAIVLESYGDPEQSLVYREVADPVPKKGEVTIEVKAFGLNHAEIHMRRGEWAEAAPISGIECVGVVAACPGGEFSVGSKVVALMGGMGRTISGSYAQLTQVPVTNVATIESDLPWDILAAIPETFATAWTCLFRNLELQEGQTLLVRGATSSFGQAAVKLAIAAGARVIATSRNESRFELLSRLGVEATAIEGGTLSERLPQTGHVDAVLDLVGNSTFMDSLRIVRRGGRVCLAGWLGGLDPIDGFNPLLQMPSGVYLTFFGSFVFGTPGFPVSDVPFQKIVDDIAAGRLDVRPTRVFGFDEIHEAHRVMEANLAGGKMVVVH